MPLRVRWDTVRRLVLSALHLLFEDIWRSPVDWCFSDSVLQLGSCTDPR